MNKEQCKKGLGLDSVIAAVRSWKKQGASREKHSSSNLLILASLGLEKEMATHSSILAWRSPWREEPGRL